MSQEQQPINRSEPTELRRARQVIAEGLRPSQLKTVLEALVHKGLVNCIGTPSREEVTRLEDSGNSGAYRALLGGFIMAGTEDLFVDATVAFVSAKDSDQRFDVSILTVPMPENDLGINTAVVAQVYPTDPNTPQLADTDIQAWLAANILEVRKVQPDIS